LVSISRTTLLVGFFAALQIIPFVTEASAQNLRSTPAAQGRKCSASEEGWKRVLSGADLETLRKLRSSQPAICSDLSKRISLRIADIEKENEAAATAAHKQRMELVDAATALGIAGDYSSDAWNCAKQLYERRVSISGDSVQIEFISNDTDFDGTRRRAPISFGSGSLAVEYVTDNRVFLSGGTTITLRDRQAVDIESVGDDFASGTFFICSDGIVAESLVVQEQIADAALRSGIVGWFKRKEFGGEACESDYRFEVHHDVLWQWDACRNSPQKFRIVSASRNVVETIFYRFVISGDDLREISAQDGSVKSFSRGQ